MLETIILGDNCFNRAIHIFMNFESFAYLQFSFAFVTSIDFFVFLSNGSSLKLGWIQLHYFERLSSNSLASSDETGLHSRPSIIHLNKGSIWLLVCINNAPNITKATKDVQQLLGILILLWKTRNPNTATSFSTLLTRERRNEIIQANSSISFLTFSGSSSTFGTVNSLKLIYHLKSSILIRAYLRLLHCLELTYHLKSGILIRSNLRLLHCIHLRELTH